MADPNFIMYTMYGIIGGFLTCAIFKLYKWVLK